ncbi:MAG: sulfatase-like hydrolase/transferase [Spirochaetes bacterium]|nr:sulfatase-like hydrolase/transferase [Spirochaetota bacterium]
MNIIYLHTHDSGRFLDPAQSPRPLPQVGRLTASAVTFRNAFSAAPTCSPSRSALLTGVSPHVNGMTGLAHRGFRITDYSRHLARVLAGAEMETVLCGVQHVAPHKSEIGYDQVLDGPTDYFTRPDLLPHEWDRENARRVARFLTAPHTRPFFLSFGLLTTHRPYPQPAPAVPERSHRRPPAVVADTPATRYDMERFLTALDVVDEAVGTVLDAIGEAGLWDDTVILLTTDHGPAFPEMKGTLQDGGVGVSLMLHVPGIADDGRVEQALVSQLDLYPTMCELAAVATPQPAEGRSLLPLLRGDAASVRDEVFAETNYHANYEPGRAIRTGRYKLIRRYGQSAPLPANVDDSAPKAVMDEAGYFNIARPDEQLVDLLIDPTERMNFTAEPAYRHVYADLAARLDAWMERTDDPLRLGAVPRPKGSRVNRQDARSAEEPTWE